MSEPTPLIAVVPVAVYTPRGKRILIVDDEPLICEMLKGRLEDWQYTTTVAHDGVEAVNLVRWNWGPDLILMDLMMPRLSGFEAIRLLKRDLATRAIPILAMSAGVNLRAKQIPGAAGVVPKPFVWTTLYYLLQFHIEAVTDLCVLQTSLSLPATA